MSLSVEGFKSSALVSPIDEHLKTLTTAQRKEQVSKSGDGAMHKGAVTGLKPDITIDVKDEDFVDLAEGKANGQKLFMFGEIKVKGVIMLATKLDSVLKGAQESTGFKAKL
ncbi:hypothetical protein BGZ74_003151 [Mortierella antarctica]|nr:hypothetical protein BGZ74_003151 [Mortierella antarctica]